MTKPVFVFAPGAWHPANSFENVASILTAKGYECHSIALPSVTRATEIKDALLTEDIAAIREVIKPLVDASRDVVLVIHSWAGVPCCSGLKGLTRAERQEKGSFFPKIGDDLSGFFAEMNINWLVANEEAKTLYPDDPIYRFYHDLPEAASLRPHALLSVGVTATGAAYLEVPSTYLTKRSH